MNPSDFDAEYDETPASTEPLQEFTLKGTIGEPEHVSVSKPIYYESELPTPADKLQQVIDEIGRDKLIEAIDEARSLMMDQFDHWQEVRDDNEIINKFLSALREDEDESE